MRGRLVILGAAAVLTAAALLLGGAFRGAARPAAEGAAAAPNAAGGLGGDVPVGGTTAQQVHQLQSELRTHPGDAHSYALLGLLEDSARHGYDLKLKLQPNQPGTLQFAAKRTGRFTIELHNGGAEIGVLEIYPK